MNEASPQQAAAPQQMHDASTNPPAASPRGSGAPPEEWVRRPVGDFDPRYKSPRSAVLLSLLFPGIGQAYTGFYVRGLMIGATIVFLFFAMSDAGGDVGPILAWTTAFAWLFSMIDAGRMAALYNYAISGGEEIEMPQDFKLPRVGGSIVAGGILLLFGGIALSNTLFNVQLDWLEDWWPVFPFALGAWLFVRGVMDHLNEKAAQERTSYADEPAAASFDADDDES